MQQETQENSIIRASSPQRTDFPLLQQAHQISQQLIYVAQQLLCDASWDWSVDATGIQKQYFCDGLRKLLGYSKQELPNEVSSWKTILHPDDFNKTPFAPPSLENDSTNPQRLELRLKHKKGHDIWVLSQYKQITEKSNSSRRIIGKFVDITALKNAPQSDSPERISQSKEAESMIQRLQKFTDTTAHEIRGYIASLGMTIDYIRDRYEENFDARAKSLLDKGSAQARDALDFLEEILLQTKEKKTSSLSIKKVRIYDLVEKAKNEVLFLFPNYQVINRVDPLAIVSVSAVGIGHLFRNLITNAIKYRSKERELQITIASKIVDGQCLIEICDNGIGAPKSQLKKMFARHHRIRPNDTVDGHGIGLAFCKDIIDHHGGTIAAKKNHAEGLTVYFTLPLDKNNADIVQLPNIKVESAAS